MNTTQLDDELKKYLAKQYAGAAIEIGSAALPVSGVGRIGVQLAGKAFTKTLGRRLAQNLGAGAASGLTSGGVYGIGRGLMEDKNPLMTGAQDALSGLAAGGVLGAGTGKIAQDKHIKALNELADKRKDWGIAFTKASGDPEKAIETLLEHQKGFVPNAFDKKGVGKTDLVWGKDGKKGYGMAHFIEKRINEGINIDDFLENLPNNIKNGQVKSKTNQPDIALIANNENTSIIKHHYDNKKRNWLLTSYNDDFKNPNNTGRTPDIPGDYVEMTPSTYSGKNTPQAVSGYRTYGNSYPDKQYFPLSDLEAKHIIPNSSKNLNPSKVIIPASIIGASEVNQTHDNKNGSGVLKGNVEINADTNGVPIFTREDISNMTLNEYAENEKSIMEQLNSFGIPTRNELEATVSNSGEVFVKSYTRSDGTKVNGYYRTK